jgi:ribosome maturation factor RimP
MGDKSPPFCYPNPDMIEKKKIEKLVAQFIEGTPLFLVAVKVSSTGRITVLADKKEGITIDECAGLSRFIEDNLDRESEDYELQVSSPGIDMPFLVAEQYLKNEGKEIEVTDNDGKKYSGILKNVTSGGFELEITPKARKGKIVEKSDISFNFDQVKSAREILKF